MPVDDSRDHAQLAEPDVEEWKADEVATASAYADQGAERWRSRDQPYARYEKTHHHGDKGKGKGKQLPALADSPGAAAAAAAAATTALQA